jgi:hypothetical protein
LMIVVVVMVTHFIYSIVLCTLYSSKFLGLTITSTLTWETYIDSVKNKLCTACYMIRNISHSCQ